MSLTIRPAEISDLDALTALLLADAEDRHTAEPKLWQLDDAAQSKTRAALESVLGAAQPPLRQHWLVAISEGRLVGATHSLLLPVPPIYAGAFGPPGLLMEDGAVTPDAPRGTRRALLEAAETDLIGTGARILLASSVPGGAWESAYARRGYAPLTLYFAKTGLARPVAFAAVRQATAEDVPEIVASSAVNRRILESLHPPFWKPHDEADDRFGAWMRRSLSLEDRDMFVSQADGRVRGYAISQPATSLHIPAAHNIAGIGVIDDFFDDALAQPARLGPEAPRAGALLSAAEAARRERGDHSVLVVCPAAWHGKIDLLERYGYHNAITWHIRQVT
ncbi:hypothetical protein M4578_10510 [Salipiger sp. P9]|uniref:hypothetical protein n=1 Tax=Salipiger pentaromativorans TaxID=2943193 RepID=UPI0021587285|nr:hypothetical protein [Salipiger pentaromativorans]MCR8548263.1 hypothetical protein [Salipiger pentaromativorans]